MANLDGRFLIISLLQRITLASGGTWCRCKVSPFAGGNGTAALPLLRLSINTQDDRVAAGV
jgi:hypothetical protein